MTQFYMTFSEVNREFKILHTSHKRALNNKRLGSVTLQFIENYPLKFPSNYNYLVSYRAISNYFNR